MLLYKDIFTDDELSSDSFPMKLVDDIIYEFKGKFVRREEGDIVLEGANASEEAPDEDGGTESAVKQGVDIVLNHNLVKMDIYEDPKCFKDYIKEYMKKLCDRLKKDGWAEDELKDWQKKMQAWVVSLIKKERFKTLEFYQGASEDAADGQLAILEFRDVDGEEIPTVMLVKAGIITEKV